MVPVVCIFEMLPMDKRFDTGYFLRLYSHREVLTSVMVSFVFITILALCSFYSSVGFVQDFKNLILWTVFVLGFPLHHVVFKMERGMSNNYIGRVIQDCIFVVVFTLIMCLFAALVSDNWEFPLSIAYICVCMIFLFLTSMVFEGLIALIKAFLRDRGWDII